MEIYLLLWSHFLISLKQSSTFNILLVLTVLMFKLVHSHASDYYKHSDFSVQKHGNNIFITVHFPLSPYYQPLQLYRVLSFPIPVNQSTTHTTSIYRLPAFSATPSSVHSLQTHLSVYDTQFFKQCEHVANYIYCHKNFAMFSTTHLDCAMALF